MCPKSRVSAFGSPSISIFLAARWDSASDPPPFTVFVAWDLFYYSVYYICFTITYETDLPINECLPTLSVVR